MREDLNRAKMHKAIDSTLSGLNGDPWLFQRVSARAAEGEIKVKKKLSTGLVLVIVLMLIAAVAVAVTLLTHQEVVEQVAVPMAVENDADVGINGSYTAEQLTELIRTLNENGITLEENNKLMQAIQSGQGYWEEETLMEICRQAFGGNYYTWTLEQQDWFEDLMVKIGFHETHQIRVPGKNNMTYEEAEAYAFKRIREEYGQDLPLEDRNIWTLSRQFLKGDEQEPEDRWSFTLDPKDMEHGRYDILFNDNNPAESAVVQADLPNKVEQYTGEQLMMKFYDLYTWSQGKWSQAVWQELHEKMQNAILNPEESFYTDCVGYQLTSYPEPDQSDISREEAIRIAKETLKISRAVMNSAVLTEYDGERAWMVELVIYLPDDGSTDEEAGNYVITIESSTGKVISLRKGTMDDSVSMAFIPEAAYEKARSGILKQSDYYRIAADAIHEKYPELEPLNENEFEPRDWGGGTAHNINFITKNVQHGNASAVVATDGTVSEVTADTEKMSGDNLFRRYRAIYGYYGQWNQVIWVQLDADMQGLEAESLDGKLLKATHYPEESSVKIRHEEAQTLGMKACGKRTAEVNTCVLVDANPHPVWIMRILTDEADDPVIGIDAETGETVFTEHFKTDYTPAYVLYSMPEIWRKMELEIQGAPYMAKVAITHKFSDMSLDEPEIDLDNAEDWELQQDSLIIRYIGRWRSMKSYEVELDENGYVIRCEETESISQKPRPDQSEIDIDVADDVPMRPHALDGSLIPTPTPQPDGRLWFMKAEIADEEFWAKFEAAMKEYGVTQDNLADKEREWLQEYGDIDTWPQPCFVIAYIMNQVEETDFQDGYPVFSSEGKPSKEIMVEKAREAFHMVADNEMGADWVNSLRINGELWNDGMKYDTGEHFGMPVWFLNFEAYEEENDTWNSKGYVQLDEDGNVLNVSLELNGNG